MTKHPVKLGIDYGTCHSKIVFRDFGAAGGDKAYVVMIGNKCLIPSTILCDGSHFIFGLRPLSERLGEELWLGSMKMRVAAEAKNDPEHFCFGPLPPLPAGFSAKDLAILTVWFLLSEGTMAARQSLNLNLDQIKLEFVLGIPMSFYEDEQLKSTFLDIARTAWEMLLRFGELDYGVTRLQDAHEKLIKAKESVGQKDDISGDEIRQWLRTEAAAAIQWSASSPHVSEGPYAQLDIGAGTTNLSLFRIVSRYEDGLQVKDRISFFGASSINTGMDAIDKSLAEFEGVANCLSLRGKEKQLLQRRSARDEVRQVWQQIHYAYSRTLARAFQEKLQSLVERASWQKHKIFFIGGGSLVDPIVDDLST